MLESALALQATSVPQGPAAVEASCSVESGKHDGKQNYNGKEIVSKVYCVEEIRVGSTRISLGFRNMYGACA